MASTQHYYTYILKCSDDSYYVGSTDDLPQRLARHNSGLASAWTAARRPVQLVYSEPYLSQSQAVKRERQIKKWSCAKKTALIQGNLAALKALSKRRKR